MGHKPCVKGPFSPSPPGARATVENRGPPATTHGPAAGQHYPKETSRPPVQEMQANFRVSIWLIIYETSMTRYMKLLERIRSITNVMVMQESHTER